MLTFLHHRNDPLGYFLAISVNHDSLTSLDGCIEPRESQVPYSIDTTEGLGFLIRRLPAAILAPSVQCLVVARRLEENC